MTSAKRFYQAAHWPYRATGLRVKSSSPYFTTSHSNENKRLSQSGPVTLDKRVKFSILTFIKAFTPPTLSLTSHIKHHKEIRMIKARGRTNFNNLDMPEFFFNLDLTL